MRQRRIPNFLTLPVLFGGLIWNGSQGGVEALGAAFASTVFLTLPYLLLFLAGVGGAGDAKMMGALGAWLRTPHCFYLLGCVGITGVVLGLFYALIRRKGRCTLQNLSFMTLWLPWLMLGPGRMRERASILPSVQVMTRMPYGVAIFTGSCLAAWGIKRWGF